MPKFNIRLKTIVTKPTRSEGLYNAKYSDEDRELSRYFLYNLVLSLISPKFTYIDVIKVHTIYLPDWRFMENAK